MFRIFQSADSNLFSSPDFNTRTNWTPCKRERVASGDRGCLRLQFLCAFAQIILILWPGLILGLGCFEEETLIGIMNGAGAAGLRRKRFKVSRLPGKNFVKSLFTFKVLGVGIDDLASR